MQKNIEMFLKGVFLFKDLKPQTLSKILEEINVDVKDFEAHQTIYSPEEYKQMLGFVLRGSCVVEKLNARGPVPLNIISKGDSFGIMAVLSDKEEFPTRIVAKNSATVVFISKEDVLDLIKRYPTVMFNLIRFLTEKIVFLNQKVATFSADSVQCKLASFILNEYKKTSSLSFAFNCKRTSDAINVGRASLYRAIGTLCEEKIIEFENKTITIIDLEGLERILK